MRIFYIDILKGVESEITQYSQTKQLANLYPNLVFHANNYSVHFLSKFNDFFSMKYNKDENVHRYALRGGKKVNFWRETERQREKDQVIEILCI